MSPARSWSPMDYFYASRGAQLAWEQTSPQLTIPAFWDALDDPSNPAFRRMGQGGGIVERVPQSNAESPLGGDALTSTTTEPVANLTGETRDRLQKGA